MNRLLTILIISLLAASSAGAQTTTRRNLKPAHSVANTEIADSLCPVDTTAFRIFGYDKTLRSNTESFFVKNLTVDTVTCLRGEIEYLTLQDVELHRRPFTLSVNLPPDATRQVNLRAWDRQNVWYYHLSPPTRTTAQATPYTVRISITAVAKE